jgi:hypothetical protein
MTPLFRRLVLSLASLVAAVGVGTRSVEAQPPKEAAKPSQARIAQMQRLLAQTLIETGPLQEALPLRRFLQTLQKYLPQEKNLSLQVDTAAFGARSADLNQTSIRMPVLPKKLSLRTLLRLAMSKLNTEVELGFWPDHIAITTPQRAAYPAVYDIRDVLQQTELLLPQMQKMQDYVDAPCDLKDLQVSDNPLWLIRLIHRDAALRNWETIKVLNGSKLAVYATPSNHERINDLLTALRRLADLAVVMHATVYEVDCDYYAKYLAPLLEQKPGKQTELPIALVPRLAESLRQQTAVLESDELKIRPGQPTVFLSLEDTFRYRVHPGNTKDQPDPLYKEGLAGFRFGVQAEVSPDRRFLRLRISRQVTQLLHITKITIPDAGTGLDVEAPNLRESSAAATMQLGDGQAILMPVAYRPPGLPEDRVWVLLAQPEIFIQEEYDLDQQGLLPRLAEDEGAVVSERRWHHIIMDPLPPVPLPSTANVQQILQEAVTDVLTSPKLKETREWIGKLLQPEDKNVVLVNGAAVAWPEEFQPSVAGFRLRMLPPPDPFLPSPSRPAVFGLQLHKFAWKGDGAKPDSATLEIVITAVGIHGDVMPPAWTIVKYTAKRDGKGWRLTLDAIVD